MVIDLVSVSATILTISAFLFVMLHYFRGMKTPPFWLWFVFGFVIVMAHGMLLNIRGLAEYGLELSTMRAAGSLLMLYGAAQLIKSYRLKISFDRKLKR